jgi:hypothetical protein
LEYYALTRRLALTKAELIAEIAEQSGLNGRWPVGQIQSR